MYRAVYCFHVCLPLGHDDSNLWKCEGICLNCCTKVKVATSKSCFKIESLTKQICIKSITEVLKYTQIKVELSSTNNMAVDFTAASKKLYWICTHVESPGWFCLSQFRMLTQCPDWYWKCTKIYLKGVPNLSDTLGQGTYVADGATIVCLDTSTKSS